MAKKKTKKKQKQSQSAEPANKIIAYTDGGCVFNPGGPGAYGVVTIDTETGECREYTDGYTATTNNRMELMAVIRALKEISGPVTIYSDSQYVINCATGLWSKNKNTDLWELYESTKGNRKIQFIWVKGHNGNPYNEKCDQLATIKMRQPGLHEDEGFLQAKKDGAEFYKKVDEHLDKNVSGGAMVVPISVPADSDEPPEITSSRDYAQRFEVHTACASAITNFYLIGNRNFKAYMTLKTGGRDKWSTVRKDKLIELIGDDEWSVVTEYLKDERQQLTCARWRCRGLTLSDAIRKVLVDTEVSENCIRG